MISRPTNQQLIEAVCAELAGKVAPAIYDAGTKVVLEMAISVLSARPSARANELAWMKEEADAIEAVASRSWTAMPEAEALATALEAYDDGRTGSLYLDAAQADYALVSEVLSCAIEAAYASGDADHIATVGRLIDQRHANQQAVTGQFMAVGRT